MKSDIYALAPIDQVAARVTAKGYEFIPSKRGAGNDSDLPIAIRPIPKKVIRSQGYSDLTGTRFGHFTVLGMSHDSYGCWVVRCDCGRFSTRTARAVKNPKNDKDRCDHCQHLMYLQRNDYWRRTGRNVDG